MTNRSLASSYLLKARTRLLVLDVLQRERAYSDVVREAQELVELVLKALLRHAGIEPPKWHDVGGLVREHHARFPGLSSGDLDRMTEASAWLRKEREASLYGDIDFIPTEQYDAEAGTRALDDATFTLSVVTRIVESAETERPGTDKA